MSQTGATIQSSPEVRLRVYRDPYIVKYDTGAICGYCSYECYFSHRHRNNLEEIAGEQSVYLPPT